MSSGIKDLELANNRHLDTLRRKNEREAGRIQKIHEDRKIDMKKAHDSELVDIRDEMLRQVSAETDKKEKVLNELNRHLEDTRKTTDRNIMEIKGESQRIRKSEFDRLNAEREVLKKDHDLFLEDLNYRFSEQASKVNEEGRLQVEKVRDLKQSELIDKEAHFKKKLSDQDEQYSTRIKREGTKYIEIKNEQDRQFKADRIGANQRQQIEIAKITDKHSQDLEGRDQVFRKGIKDQDLMFEQKYAETLRTHNSNLSNLTQRNDEVINKMKSSLGQQISTTTSKKDDPFYNFTELRPEVTHTEEGVVVKVGIPEHSKQDVSLALNGKEVIVNYTRRHTDSRKSETSLNKVQKVESMSSRVKTDYHLDPKSVKASYADGVMTYTVKKS